MSLSGIFMIKPVCHCPTTQQLQQPEGHTPLFLITSISQALAKSSSDKLWPESLFIKQRGREREKEKMLQHWPQTPLWHAFTLLKGWNLCSFSLFGLWSAESTDWTNYYAYTGCMTTQCDWANGVFHGVHTCVDSLSISCNTYKCRRGLAWWLEK